MSLAHLRRLAGIGDSSAYRDVDEAIQPIGTVHSRKDGDWVKTADGWVRVKKKDKAAIIGTKTPPKVSRPRKTANVPPASVPPPKAPPAPPAPAPAPPVPAVKAASATMQPVSGPLTDAERAKVAEKVTPVVTQAMKALGDDYDSAQFTGKTVQASFRTWDLPKDPPPDPSDYDDEDDAYDSDYDAGDYYAYQDKVGEILKNTRAHLKAKLADVADKIERISLGVGDKNWIEVDVILK